MNGDINVKRTYLYCLNICVLQAYQMSLVMRNPVICICENKGADQLRGSREADQRLCFRYTDSTIPLLLKSEISCLQPSSVTEQSGLCIPGRTPRRPVFSQRGSNGFAILVRPIPNEFTQGQSSFRIQTLLIRLKMLGSG